ncbi:MAG: hypothetical protein OXG35_11375 [Acidobacteria bacterium]|nr:hypothetical protein [Acidobacteriota bacterium]
MLDPVDSSLLALRLRPRRRPVLRLALVAVVVLVVVGLPALSERAARGPVARGPDGRPRLDGVWRGPSGASLDHDAVTAFPPELADALEAAGRTATGFPGARGRSGYRSLRRDRGSKLRPETASELRRRDRARLDRGEADSWVDRNTWERCLTRGLPPAALPGPQADRWQILQTPGVVAIVSEALHEVRLVRTDGELPPPVVQQWLGTSVGRWAGDTLVVTTMGVRSPLDGGLPAAADPLPGAHPGPGSDVVLTERWTPADGRRLDYELVVSDPRTYRSEVVYRFALEREPAGSVLFEYACHEGNRSMTGMLAGNRADEARGRYWSAVGVAERAWMGRPGVAGPARPFVAPERVDLPFLGGQGSRVSSR